MTTISPTDPATAAIQQQLDKLWNQALTIEHQSTAAVAGLAEVFVLIAAHLRNEGVKLSECTCRLRHDDGRERWILELSAPPPESSHGTGQPVDLQRVPESAATLQARRQLLLALGEQLNLTVADHRLQGQLHGYTLVLPEAWKPAASPEAELHSESMQNESAPRKGPSKREKLRTIFISSIPADLERLEAARNSEDWEAVKSIAHQLKGCAASFGFPEVTQSAADLNDAVGDQSPDDLHRLLDRMEDELKRAMSSAD